MSDLLKPPVPPMLEIYESVRLSYRESSVNIAPQVLLQAWMNAFAYRRELSSFGLTAVDDINSLGNGDLVGIISPLVHNKFTPKTKKPELPIATLGMVYQNGQTEQGDVMVSLSSKAARLQWPEQLEIHGVEGYKYYQLATVNHDNLLTWAIIDNKATIATDDLTARSGSLNYLSGSRWIFRLPSEVVEAIKREPDFGTQFPSK